MYLIIGLGNPEKKYEKTRHNAGFLAVDFIITHWTNQGLSETRTAQELSLQTQTPQTQFKENKKLKSLIAEMELSGQKVILAKPQTYMNTSGQAVAKLVKKYCDKSLSAEALKGGDGAKADKLIVIYDELDLPFETLRVKLGGSSAGHNGIKSIMENLGTKDFWRARIGISNEKRELMPADRFVLSKFSQEELEILNEKILPSVVEEIEKIM